MIRRALISMTSKYSRSPRAAVNLFIYTSLLIFVVLASVLFLYNTHSHGIFGNDAMADEPLRPEIRAAISLIAALPVIGIVQTTDSLSSPGRSASIEPPTAFPASAYRISFGDSARHVAFLANTEITVAHYVTIEPGVTRLQGCVTLENGISQSGQPCMTDTELEYLLQAIYRKLHSGQPTGDAAALNRFKDAVLAIRFGQQDGAKLFHERMVRQSR